MCEHPALRHVLVCDRVAELQVSAQHCGQSPRGSRRPAIIEAVRQRAGWLLVDAGLRLAVSRGVRGSRRAARPAMTP